MQLDTTKNIDRYLSGELSASDHAAFEESLKTNLELQQEVELQLLIKEAAIRASFRADVQHAARRFKLNRIIKWGAAGLGAVAVIVATTFWVSSKKTTVQTEKEAPTIALSMMEELSSNADFDPLPIQYFSVPKEGDVFLSDQSVLLSIPKKAFLLKDKIYSGEAIVQFQEAMQAHEIVKAGLNTKSGNDLLETQGMFSIHAFTPDGEQLEINPKVGVYVQVPVNEHKEGMQLYDYVDLGNGKGDWQNPRGLSRIPVPVDMNDLDFYPDGYETQLDKLKWKRSKSKRDSLYLSFENYCSFQTIVPDRHEGNSKNLLITEPAITQRQTDDQPRINRNTMVVKFPDVDARFPGGGTAMRDFINETCVYPDEAIEKGLSGRVYISMEIDVYGLISNKEIETSAHPVLDREAMRIVNQMPQWIPAQSNKRAVRSRVRIPIDFKLENALKTKGVDSGPGMMLRPRSGNIKNGEKYAETPVSFELILQEDTKQEELKGSTDQQLVDSTIADTPCDYPRIAPSKVLAFWKPEFNNTNLATREFERRMKAIHETCDENVLKKYTSQLGKPISEIDRSVANMGYSDFSAFAEEQVGAVNSNNPHLKNIKAFYEKGIAALKKKAEADQDWEQQLRNKWDQHLAELRSAHSASTKKQAEKSLQEETKYNQQRTVQKLGLKYQRGLNPVAAYPQFRNTIGFTARRSGGYNCDRAVTRIVTYQAALRTSLDKETVEKRKIERLSVEVDVENGTETRETFSVTENGRTRTIAYNSLSFAVKNPQKYNKIMAYAFPHQLESYQLLEGENGNFITSLNDDIIYDICIVGLTDDGYEYFQKQTLKGGSLGTIELQRISESKLDASLLQMNSKRNSKSTSFNSELDWIKAEKKYFKEIDRRQEMDEFRETIVRSIYPCYESLESAKVGLIEAEKIEVETEFALQSGVAVDL